MCSAQVATIDPGARLAHDQASHKLGSYHSWDLDPGRGAPVDMIWISDAAPSAEPQQLMPFLEPSIAIRRIVRENGTYDNVELLVSAAMPDNGWYCPALGEQLIGIRLRPELSGSQLGIWAQDHQDHHDHLPPSAPPSLLIAAATALRAAEKRQASDVALTLLESVHRATRSVSHEWTTQAVDLIRHRKGQISCAALADEMDVSTRHLHRTFKAHFGYSPKEYTRRARFTAAMIAADGQAIPCWADIALSFGYSDQSHLNRDCREFLQSSPAQAHRARNAMSDSSKTQP